MIPAVLLLGAIVARFIPVPEGVLKNHSLGAWSSIYRSVKERLQDGLDTVMLIHGFNTNNTSYSTCSSLYVITDPFETLEYLPSSYDLREIGLQTPVRDQGACGSCWAFGSMTLVEAAIMAAHTSYSGTQQAPYFGNVLTEGSVQYLMNTSRTGANNFCSGGNFVYVAFDYANQVTPTVELQSNYPYTSANLYTNPPVITKHAPKIPSEAYLLPFAKTKIGRSCYSSLIRIYDNTRRPFDRHTINVIKSYIARGIPVLGAMFVDGGGIQGTNKFSHYSGGLFTEPCRTYGADHQIAFIGYGYYKGTEAWVVRNSWGEGWGDFGYFYVPIGQNTLCIEHYAYTAIPAQGPLAGALAKSHSFASPKRATREHDGIYSPAADRYTYYDNKIVRGANGLDIDDGTFAIISQRLKTWQLVGIVIGSIVGVIVLVGVVMLAVYATKYTKSATTIAAAKTGIHNKSWNKYLQPQFQNIIG